MNRSLARRVVLLIAFGLTVALPLATAVRVIAAGGATGGEGTFGVEPFLAALGLLTVINAAVGVAILWRRPGNLVGALLLIGSLMMTSVVAAWTRLIVIGPTPTGDTRDAPHLVGAAGPPPGGLRPVPDGRPRLPGRAPARPTLAMALRPRRRRPWSSASSCRRSRRLPPKAARTRWSAHSPSRACHVEVGELGAALAIIAVLAAFVLALGSVVVRFRRSSGVERAQVKWLVAAVALMSAIFPVSYLVEIGPEGLLDVRLSSSAASSRSRSASRSCATACTTSIASSAARCRGRS